MFGEIVGQSHLSIHDNRLLFVKNINLVANVRIGKRYDTRPATAIHCNWNELDIDVLCKIDVNAVNLTHEIETFNLILTSHHKIIRSHLYVESYGMHHVIVCRKINSTTIVTCHIIIKCFPRHHVPYRILIHPRTDYHHPLSISTTST